jgi:hypothetical protein
VSISECYTDSYQNVFIFSFVCVILAIIVNRIIAPKIAHLVPEPVNKKDIADVIKNPRSKSVAQWESMLSMCEAPNLTSSTKKKQQQQIISENLAQPHAPESPHYLGDWM